MKRLFGVDWPRTSLLASRTNITPDLVPFYLVCIAPAREFLWRQIDMLMCCSIATCKAPRQSSGSSVCTSKYNIAGKI